MNSFLSNTISKLYNAVSAPVAATRDALTERLDDRMMENMRYGQKRLKDIIEKEAEEEEQQQEEEEETKEQQQDDDDERYTVAKIKLAYEGRRVKEFRVTGNSKQP